MDKLIAVCFLLLTLTNTIHGFSSGNLPPSACESGPQHGGSPQTTEAITVQVTDSQGLPVTTYTPGETLTGRLWYFMDSMRCRDG